MGMVLSRMQLNLRATRPTPHGAPRLGQAMSNWSVKTRRTPSRDCRDARVYGNTTTAMHSLSTPLPPPPVMVVVVLAGHDVASTKNMLL